MSSPGRASEDHNTSGDKGFFGWSPETTEEASAYTVAANNAGVIAPDTITSPDQPKPDQRSRD